ncbi:hypothetical protein THAOC_02524 [Thalassiosira oceanica]|uniref:Uncharacterized protein n=1 Tax=Thalassiosira oceanica TaxID=159749 RepID=K0TM00_THAOC|nr:hypothetical protein THAOC_02524 [Thalassiosira oceanica]|eukprot:EJK75746.1 hypothetical protein THAOC_02524 [Thalassiosira oceanica]
MMNVTPNLATMIIMPCSRTSKTKRSSRTTWMQWTCWSSSTDYTSNDAGILQYITEIHWLEALAKPLDVSFPYGQGGHHCVPQNPGGGYYRELSKELEKWEDANVTSIRDDAKALHEDLEATAFLTEFSQENSILSTWNAAALQGKLGLCQKLSTYEVSLSQSLPALCPGRCPGVSRPSQQAGWRHARQTAPTLARRGPTRAATHTLWNSPSAHALHAL